MYEYKFCNKKGNLLYISQEMSLGISVMGGSITTQSYKVGQSLWLDK